MAVLLDQPFGVVATTKARTASRTSSMVWKMRLILPSEAVRLRYGFEPEEDRDGEQEAPA
jgi:hypothetical protein